MLTEGREGRKEYVSSRDATRPNQMAINVSGVQIDGLLNFVVFATFCKTTSLFNRN